MSRKYILILIPPVIVLCLWLIVKVESFSVMDQELVEIASFTDSMDGGNSEIVNVEDKATHKAITFKLKPGFISPYAGISFYEEDYWDLSDYNLVELEVETENSKNLEMSVTTYQNGVTKENQPFTFRHNVIEVPVSGNKTVCALKLDDMHTAQWWLEKFKLRSTELGPVDWQKVKSLSFTAKIRLDQTLPQSLKINKITFAKDLTVFYIGSLIFAVVWYLALFIYYRFWPETGKNASEVVIRYQKINEEEGSSDDDSELLSFITNNYTDPDLTLQKLSEIMKRSEKSLSTLIKKKYNASFKELLNGIRLTEAKRLLIESDKNVSEIAYQVGFNSPNHFNRTFKTHQGCTPTEFRMGEKVLTN